MFASGVTSIFKTLGAMTRTWADVVRGVPRHDEFEETFVSNDLLKAWREKRALTPDSDLNKEVSSHHVHATWDVLLQVIRQFLSGKFPVNVYNISRFNTILSTVVKGLIDADSYLLSRVVIVATIVFYLIRKTDLRDRENKEFRFRDLKNFAVDFSKFSGIKDQFCANDLRRAEVECLKACHFDIPQFCSADVMAVLFVRFNVQMRSRKKNIGNEDEIWREAKALLCRKIFAGEDIGYGTALECLQTSVPQESMSLF